MAYIAIFYSSTFGQKFSLMESMASFGQILGPVLGSLFHYYFGYCVPLLGLFGLLIACLCFCQQAIPSDNNLP
jgi:MFS family permease